MGATAQRFGYQFREWFCRLDFGVKFWETDPCLGEIGATLSGQNGVLTCPRESQSWAALPWIGYGGAQRRARAWGGQQWFVPFPAGPPAVRGWI